MVKSIIKEICIMLLLCIAIILILGVIFYDSIPSNKVVPNKIAQYETPENVQAEIQEQITEMNKVEISYQVTKSDLELFKDKHIYDPQKPDPFSSTILPGSTTDPGDNTVTGNDVDENNTIVDPNSPTSLFNHQGQK